MSVIGSVSNAAHHVSQSIKHPFQNADDNGTRAPYGMTREQAEARLAAMGIKPPSKISTILQNVGVLGGMGAAIGFGASFFTLPVVGQVGAPIAAAIGGAIGVVIGAVKSFFDIRGKQRDYDRKVEHVQQHYSHQAPAWSPTSSKDSSPVQVPTPEVCTPAQKPTVVLPLAPSKTESTPKQDAPPAPTKTDSSPKQESPSVPTKSDPVPSKSDSTPKQDAPPVPSKSDSTPKQDAPSVPSKSDPVPTKVDPRPDKGNDYKHRVHQHSDHGKHKGHDKTNESSAPPVVTIPPVTAPPA